MSTHDVNSDKFDLDSLCDNESKTEFNLSDWRGIKNTGRNIWLSYSKPSSYRSTVSVLEMF